MKKRACKAIIGALTVVLMVGSLALAKHGQGKGQGKVKAHFSQRERKLIRQYFRDRQSGLPPGLAKRGGDLPPGLEKQLRRRGTLPPGLEKRVEPFPEDLLRQLPPLPPGYSRGVIGGRAVIIDRANQVVDVMLLQAK